MFFIEKIENHRCYWLLSLQPKHASYRSKKILHKVQF